jgi:protein TonB
VEEGIAKRGFNDYLCKKKMRRIVLFTLLLAWSMLPALAQETGERKDSVLIFIDDAEYMPSFRGGTRGLNNFIAENLRWPEGEEESCIQGRVIIGFIVEKDGSLSDIKVVKSLHPSFDKEALRVVKAMPKWSPGRRKGECCRMKYNIPIIFRTTPSTS